MANPKTRKWRELVKRFSKMKHRIHDLSPFWNMIVPIIHNMTMKRFASGGPGWVELAPATIKKRIAESTWRIGVGKDQPILQRHGDLRRSVMAMDSGASSKHFEIIKPRSLTYGTRMKKGIYLQGDLDKWIPGAPRSAYSIRLAPRPFLFFEDSDAEAILEMGVVYLDKLLDDL